MQEKKNELDKIKEENLMKIKSSRELKFEKMRTNRSAIELIENKRRQSILIDEEEKFDRALSKENKYNYLKLFSKRIIILNLKLQVFFLLLFFFLRLLFLIY